MRHLIFLALGLLAARRLMKLCRKPTSGDGRLVLWGMNLSHSRLTNWGLTHVQIGKQFTILDVGCGGGRTVQKLAAMATEGKVYGVDYSESSVAASRRTNRQEIDAGRVAIQLASVSRLPFPDRTFDLVTAVETHYYWPDLPADVREIRRVLKSGGTLLIIAEAYKGSAYDALYGLVMKALKAAYLTVEEHRDLLSTAGYSDVEVFTERKKGWICVTGKRPESSS